MPLFVSVPPPRLSVPKPMMLPVALLTKSRLLVDSADDDACRSITPALAESMPASTSVPSVTARVPLLSSFALMADVLEGAKAPLNATVPLLMSRPPDAVEITPLPSGVRYSVAPASLTMVPVVPSVSPLLPTMLSRFWLTSVRWSNDTVLVLME